MDIIVALWPIFARPVIGRITCSHRKLVMKYNIYTSTISPNWIPNDLSRVQSRLYVCLSISISGHPCHFLVIVRVDCNCRQWLRMQATGSNTLSGSIICPSIHPVVHGSFAIFGFVLIFSVGVQCCDTILYERNESVIKTLLLNWSPGHPRWIPVNQLNPVFLWPLHALTQNGALHNLFTC